MKELSDKIAIVTGASRGLGKGIALGLGEAGATVYVTGRTDRVGTGALPGDIVTTAAEVTRLGGEGIAARCDHRDDEDVVRLFERVAREQGRLDVLVNNALGSPDQRVLWGAHRFWEVPVSLWDDLVDVGLRSHFVAAWHAVPMMIGRKSGLIVNVASHASGAGKSARSRVLLAYSVGKAGVQRLTQDMAVELRDFGVAVVSIWPPASRTEGVLAQASQLGDPSSWKEPIFTGRVVAAFIAKSDVFARTGESLAVTDLAAEIGVSAT